MVASTRSLEMPVQYIPRVGPAMAKGLLRLGIHTVRDLLLYPPFRYNDFSLCPPIQSLRPGEIVTIQGTVVSFENVFTKSYKKLARARIQDKSGILTVIWFNQLYLSKIITVGSMIQLSGKVDWFGHELSMQSPEYEIVSNDKETLHTGRIVPVYPETHGVSSKWLRGRMRFALTEYDDLLEDTLPDVIRSRYAFPRLAQTLESIHFPTSLAKAEDARKHLAFLEIFFLVLRSNYTRAKWIQTKHSPILSLSDEDKESFLSFLPFTLTSDQQNASAEILQDLGRSVPMNRLLIGDVGSGKTVVAAFACFASYKNGYKSVIMAPTQILAEQHFNSLQEIFRKTTIKIGLVTSKSKKSDDLSAFDILVGTHALLTKEREFSKLGLIVIDEQHRFGVRQRQLLEEKEKSHTPHILTMTATPIPRTITLTVYGNLDVSILSSLPVGRVRVKTWLVGNEKRENAYKWARNHIKNEHGQIFIVCPFIEESESMATVKAAESEFLRLKNTVFREYNIGLLHGKQKADEKKKTLEDFRNRKLDILVTTPVVEVGIDIPGATVMIIEAAERFGLSQLHQLRGRVGRGMKQSYCYLFSESLDETSKIRLKTLETVYSGPELSEIDLSIRGPGEMYGLKQHGIPLFHFARLSDQTIMASAQKEVRTLIEKDPELKDFPHLRIRMEKATIEPSIAQN
ncbi:ATP-dependent DNA helicase RecG [Candidatus Gottesmanbacteria bacterium]|nr:ATP-dependent DNA helicase RecG [Candidatus Gottesmanbacteria bacterium]